MTTSFLPLLRATVLCLSMLALNVQAAPAWNIDRLMQYMHDHPGGETRFTEKKYLSMLKAPLESSGILRYRPPDLLEMNVVKPERQSMRLEHESLTISNTDHSNTLNLNDYPELSALISSIRSTLAGDRPALERLFRLYLQGTEAHWNLILLPKKPDEIPSIRRINLAGEAQYLVRVEIELRDGDHSVISIDKPR